MSDETLRCPLCEYDVRGLPEPRCPECGHRFEWEELTDPARQRVRWLFEHRRRLGGYLGTQARLLWPWGFWRRVRPAHVLVGRRLIAFVLIGVVVGPLLPVATIVTGEYARAWQGNARFVAQMRRPVGQTQLQQIAKIDPGLAARLPPAPTYADLQGALARMTGAQYLQRFAPRPDFAAYVGKTIAELEGSWREVTGCMAALAAPFAAALLVLGIMRQSFSKAKIRPGHGLRVAAYSTDLLPASLGFGLGLLAYYAHAIQGPMPRGLPIGGAAALLGGLLVVVMMARLEAGVRIYLGVRRGWAVSLAWAVIAGLSAVIVYGAVSGHLWR